MLELGELGVHVGELQPPGHTYSVGVGDALMKLISMTGSWKQESHESVL
jgi:hypothetical protein